MKNIVLIIVLLITSINLSFAGGPWPQPKGKGYFKLSESWIVFNQHFTDVGLIDPNTTTGIFNTNFYGEYGITNKLTGIVNGPFFTRNYMNNLVSATTGEILVPGEAVNALGDIDLGLKYGVKVSGLEIPVSATLILGLPTGNPSAGTQGNLQTGDGEFNQMLQIDAGAGFNLTPKISSYFSTYVGFNNRTNGFSEEFRYGIEYGVSFMDRKLWIIGRIGGVESLKNGETAATITSTSVFANNTEYTSFSLEAAYYVSKRVGFSASFAGAFRGEIIAAAPTYSVGIFYDLAK
ncbi:MAG: hypothetical protein ACJAUH_003037 [Saprospiraceae bacterium]|jgi:hypothetical protein